MRMRLLLELGYFIDSPRFAPHGCYVTRHEVRGFRPIIDAAVIAIS